VDSMAALIGWSITAVFVVIVILILALSGGR
jgi:hypothetical protein